MGFILVINVPAVEVHSEQVPSGQKGAAVWLPGDGEWSDQSHWAGGIVPGLGIDLPKILIDAQLDDINQYGGDDDVFAGDRVYSHVRLSIGVNIADVSLGPEDVINIEGGHITFDNRANQAIVLFNGGELLVQPNGTVSVIRIAGGKTV